MAKSTTVRERKRNYSGRKPTDRGVIDAASNLKKALQIGCLSISVIIFASVCWSLWVLKPLDAEVKVYSYKIVQEHYHDPSSFTQGLLWQNNSLYESTGLYGRSSIQEIRLDGNGSAHTVRKIGLHKKHFGEGLTFFGGELLQLLWKRGEGLRYSAQAGDGGHLKRQGTFHIPFDDGWGLTSTKDSLVMTNSGSAVYFLNPKDFSVERRINVTDSGKAIEMVNELEIINGELWANVYATECIARISLETGNVIGWILLDGLLHRAVQRSSIGGKAQEGPDVLNGIAWDPIDRRLFVTGKLWPILFEMEIVPTSDVKLEDAQSQCIPKKNLFH